MVLKIVIFILTVFLIGWLARKIVTSSTQLRNAHPESYEAKSLMMQLWFQKTFLLVSALICMLQIIFFKKSP
jgi:hypothetical protein